jgi:hypothetical protein
MNLLRAAPSEPALRHARPQLHSRLDSREEGRKGSELLAEGLRLLDKPVSHHLGAGPALADPIFLTLGAPT